MRRGIRLLVPALVLSAGATACSDNPTAGTLPTTPPPASQPPVSRPPSSSTAPTVEDVVAAARKFYEVLAAAARNPGDGAEKVEALLHPDCPCQQIVEFLEDQASRGHRIERAVSVSDVRVAERTANAATVFLTLRQGEGQVLDDRGAVVERLKATQDGVVLDFAVKDQKFLVARLSTEAS